MYRSQLRSSLVKLVSSLLQLAMRKPTTIVFTFSKKVTMISASNHNFPIPSLRLNFFLLSRINKLLVLAYFISCLRPEKLNRYMLASRSFYLIDNLSFNYRPCPADKVGWNMNKTVLTFIRKYLLGLSFVDGELHIF